MMDHKIVILEIVPNNALTVFNIFFTINVTPPISNENKQLLEKIK
jgi:hypothetical protein